MGPKKAGAKSRAKGGKVTKKIGNNNNKKK
jgi:hypothetical protein